MHNTLHTHYIAVIGHNLNLVLHTDECHNFYINKHFFHILQHFFFGQFISTIGACVSAIFQIILHQGYEKATPTTTEAETCSYQILKQPSVCFRFSNHIHITVDTNCLNWTSSSDNWPCSHMLS